MSQAQSDNTTSAPRRGAPKPIRAALVVGRETLRRLGPVVGHLIVGLLDEPLPVTLACPAETDIANIPTPPVNVVRYEPNRLPLLRGKSIESLSAHLRRAGVSLLHALDTDAAEITRRLSLELDVDYVVGTYSLATLRTTLRSGASLRSAINGDVRACQRHCRAVLAASEPIRQSLLESQAAHSEIIHLLRPGVLQARGATCFADPRHAAALVAAGELHEFRPFAAVMEVFAKLQAARRDCVFFIVGQGRCETRLRRLAERLGLMENLTFVNLQDSGQLGGILRAADIFISPAPSGRFQMELLLAMAAGVPVLAANAHASDFIIADKTALTFSPDDTGDLAAKLARMMDDHAATSAMAERALEYLGENHSPTDMVGKIVEIYRLASVRRIQQD